MGHTLPLHSPADRYSFRRSSATLAATSRAIPAFVYRDAIRDYAAFGGVLRSAIEFPELTVASDCTRPDWTLIVDRAEPPDHALVLVGERRVRNERYWLWRSPAGLRLEYSHAGTFDVSIDGSLIVWYYRQDATPELVRSIVLGPAIALALELAGLLCLHGSAVSIGTGAVAFIGPKHFGKSTLATALTTAGARLLGDDLLVVDPGPPASVRPGVASVRLWADMAASLPLDTVCDRLIPGVKTTATDFAAESLASGPAPLSAIYVLSPVAKDGDARAAWRTRLTPVEATIALAHQTKLPDALVGLRAAATHLSAAAAVAETVPVWTLNVVRDVSRLDAMVRQILDWSSAE